MVHNNSNLITAQNVNSHPCGIYVACTEKILLFILQTYNMLNLEILLTLRLNIMALLTKY